MLEVEVILGFVDRAKVKALVCGMGPGRRIAR
jgi:hypothetical protein